MYLMYLLKVPVLFFIFVLSCFLFFVFFFFSSRRRHTRLVSDWSSDVCSSDLELCDNPPQGGTTPSYGAILGARRQLIAQLHVIVRPRGGDFLYSAAEFDVMKNDIDVCKDMGVHGVVIGILLPDGTVDKARTRELVERAKPMSVTFHRAFDMTSDPKQTLEDVIETGCSRVLTSGQQPTAME